MSNDNSADPIDQAGETAQLFLDADIAAARGKSGPDSHPNFDGLHCVEEDCGVEIPQARLDHGRVRCVDCASLMEKRRSMRR